MEDKDFRGLRQSLAAIIRQNKDTCRKGYADLVYAKDMDDLAKVIRTYWADLNRLLWAEFQECLMTYYPKVENELKSRGIYYNLPCSDGLCVVDEHCESDCLVLKGVSQTVVHDHASVLLLDNAHATMLDSSRAIATATSSVDARMFSRVQAKDSATVRAFDRAHIESDGMTEIYLYGCSQLKRIRARKVEAGISAKIITN